MPPTPADTQQPSPASCSTETDCVYLIIVRPGGSLGWMVDSWYAVHEHRLEYIKAKMLNKNPPAECVINLFQWKLRARYNMGEILHIRSEVPLEKETVEQLIHNDPDFITRYRIRDI